MKGVFFIQFKTMYQERKRIASNPGVEEEAVYASRYDNDGNIELYVEHTRNNQLEIESYREACELANLLERYQAGDASALSQKQGVYIDTVGMPHSMCELLNVVADGETNFKKLPIQVREEFGNSLAQYLAAMDNPKEFNKRMSKFYPEQQQIAKEQSKINEKEAKAE